MDPERTIQSEAAPGARRLGDALRGLESYIATGRRTHVQEVRELYRDDPYVTPEEYGRLMQEADERDQADEANAELPAVWEERAEAEEMEEEEYEL